MNREEVTAEAVKRAELDFILNRKPGDPKKDPPLWGLALSGGGIRSATFALGVLQVLARNKLLGSFHYLSTISGGGYAGAFLQGLIRRRGFDGAYGVLRSSVRDVAQRTAANRTGNVAADAQQPIRHLREYSNYLSPRKTTVSGCVRCRERGRRATHGSPLQRHYVPAYSSCVCRRAISSSLTPRRFIANITSASQ